MCVSFLQFCVMVMNFCCRRMVKALLKNQTLSSQFGEYMKPLTPVVAICILERQLWKWPKVNKFDQVRLG